MLWNVPQSEDVFGCSSPFSETCLFWAGKLAYCCFHSGYDDFLELLLGMESRVIPSTCCSPLSSLSSVIWLFSRVSSH